MASQLRYILFFFFIALQVFCCRQSSSFYYLKQSLNINAKNITESFTASATYETHDDVISLKSTHYF